MTDNWPHESIRLRDSWVLTTSECFKEGILTELRLGMWVRAGLVMGMDNLLRKEQNN